MEDDIRQSANYRPKHLFIGRAQHAGKPTKLENNKVPKFSHSQHPKKKAPAEGAMAFRFGGESGIWTPDLRIMIPSL